MFTFVALSTPKGMLMRVNGDDDVEGDQHAHMCANNNASVSNSHPENVSNVSSKLFNCREVPVMFSEQKLGCSLRSDQEPGTRHEEPTTGHFACR